MATVKFIPNDCTDLSTAAGLVLKAATGLFWYANCRPNDDRSTFVIMVRSVDKMHNGEYYHELKELSGDIRTETVVDRLNKTIEAAINYANSRGQDA